MVQNCQVDITIWCYKHYRENLINYLNEYFKTHKYMYNYSQKQVICSYDIVETIDMTRGIILINIYLDIDNECAYIGGNAGSRWDPGEPAYIDGYLDEQDFKDWIEDITKDFKIEEIRIDKTSIIPTEEELVNEFEDYIAEEDWCAKY